MNKVRADFEQLYRVRDPFGSSFIRGAIRFGPAHDRTLIFRGLDRPERSLAIGRAEGKMATDVVWTDSPGFLLVSERLVAILQSEDLTGWTTYPVSLQGVEQTYFGLSVTGQCGPLDPTRGEWVRKDDEPGRFLRGTFFDDDSWDGSDFFSPVGTLVLFVTVRVKRCFDRHKIANVRFVRLMDDMTAELVLRSAPGGRDSSSM